MPKPFNVFRTVDLEQGRLLTIIMEKDISEDRPPVVSICGEVVKEPRQNVIPENWYVFVHDVHAPTAGTP
jgi:hypothetical protein